MPILLTTPWDPGAYDSGNTYPRAKIVENQHLINEKMIQLKVSFGDVVAAVWTPGAAGKDLTVLIEGTDYDTLVAALSNDGESVYNGAKRLLYDYLQTNYTELAGTIE